jgi:RND family efflux transporter MFP subunit
VVAGQTLVELDGGDVRARVESARARAELARRSFRRIENLHEEGAASAQELDEARAMLDQAEAGLRDARSQLEYVEVRAPFGGVVTARMVDPGDLAAPGRPLLRVVGGGAREVEADLPAEWSGRLAAGDPVQVRVGGDEAVLPARITRVSTALEPGSRRFRVEAVFEGGVPSGVDLTPGSYARLEVERPGGSGTGRWIPADAVIRRGQLTGVFAVEDAVLRLRWLRVGRTRGEAVEVLAGPPGTLEVVRRPGPTLADGQVVTGTEREAWAGPASASAASSTDGEGA